MDILLIHEKQANENPVVIICLPCDFLKVYCFHIILDNVSVSFEFYKNKDIYFHVSPKHMFSYVAVFSVFSPRLTL